MWVGESIGKRGFYPLKRKKITELLQWDLFHSCHSSKVLLIINLNFQSPFEEWKMYRVIRKGGTQLSKCSSNNSVCSTRDPEFCQRVSGRCGGCRRQPLGAEICQRWGRERESEEGRKSDCQGCLRLGLTTMVMTAFIGMQLCTCRSGRKCMRFLSQEHSWHTVSCSDY
jgi:hypothetical protein